MRVIIEFPSDWSVPQVVAILDFLELLHGGLRDHYGPALREALEEDCDSHDDRACPQLNDDIPF